MAKLASKTVKISKERITIYEVVEKAEENPEFIKKYKGEFSTDRVDDSNLKVNSRFSVM